MNIPQLVAELDRRDILDRARKIALTYHVTVPELLEVNRFRPAELARAELWWSLFAEGCWSYSRLAVLFGRDRTTIRKGVRQHQARVDARRVA